MRNRRTKPRGISLVAGSQRITSLLALSGMGALGECERYILQGRVTRNGKVVRYPNARADPSRDVLAVDGVPVALGPFCRYLIVNKPYRVLCCFSDPEGRATLADFVPVPDVYAAGRLDYDSEGLVLLTDDGWLNHRLTHPRYAHPKTYLVQVERIPDEAALEALRRGVPVKGRRARAAEVRRLGPEELPPIPPRVPPIRYRKNVPTAWLRIVLNEGRKRQIRHMTAAVGHPTLRLLRIAIGPIELGTLPPGKWRTLTTEEIDALRRALRQNRHPWRSGNRARR